MFATSPVRLRSLPNGRTAATTDWATCGEPLPGTPVIGVVFSESSSGTKEGPVSISERCKSRVETPPTVSKSRQTLRRPIESAMLHGHPIRVNATKLPRRQFLHVAAGAAALSGVSRIAWSQTYPSRPVRMIVGFAAGGGTDFTARLIGQWLAQRLGQPFLIENRPGAGGNIATEAVVRAPPDGHTLLLVYSANAINASLYDKLNFNFMRDIAPIAGVVREANVMVAHPSVPAKTVAEFIAYAKANPGKINMASGGNGSVGHVAGELFKMMAGVNLVQVSYRGAAPALTDLLGGQVQVSFVGLSGSIAYIKAGNLRALAVTSATRSEGLPDVPTVGEFVPNFEASAFFGVGAPKNTPAEIIGKLNSEINAALADPRMKARLADTGGAPLVGSPADFGKLIADETEKWAKVIRAANIKTE
jgi:tripartite-type tricarboxylate transporter receptor subunit TctC